MTAATLMTSLSLSASPTAYVGYVISGVGFVVRHAIGSAWLSQTLQWSTTSLIGVSGGTLSKYRRKSQLSCPATNLSRISRNRAVCPISPNAFTANVSNAVAKIVGSSLTFLVVRSSCLYSLQADPENHSGPLMRLPVLIVITVAPVVLNGQRLAHLPPDERIAVRLLYRYPSHSTAQLPLILFPTSSSVEPWHFRCRECRPPGRLNHSSPSSSVVLTPPVSGCAIFPTITEKFFLHSVFPRWIRRAQSWTRAPNCSASKFTGEYIETKTGTV